MTDTPPTITVAPVPALPRISFRQRAWDWSKQSTTQQGLSLLAGGCTLAWLHPFVSAEGIGATLIAASIPRLWPDNSTDAIKQRDIANAIAHLAATRQVAALEPIAADVAAIAEAEVTKP